MSVSIEVISLIGATERQQQATRQLEALGLPFTIHQFERWQSDTHPDYDPVARGRRFGYGLSQGELGCFDSHRQVWRRIADSGQNAVVLEDDFQILSSEVFRDAVTYAERLCYGLMRLQATFEKPADLVHSFQGFKTVTFQGNPAGSLAYYLDAPSAKRLLEASHRFYVPVDDFIDQEWRHETVVMGVHPYPVGSSDMESEIGERAKVRLRGWAKLKAEIWKGFDSIRSRWYLRQVRPKIIDQYRSISPSGRVLNRR